MKEMIAILRMNAIQKTKRAIDELGIPSMTVERVYGRGKQKGLHLFPAGKIDPEDRKGDGMRYIPKKMITMVVPDDRVDELLQIIMKTNRTGMIGDGKIFVSPVSDAIRIRTGENGEEAI